MGFHVSVFSIVLACIGLGGSAVAEVSEADYLALLERMSRLEARVIELEGRLATTETTTRAVRQEVAQVREQAPVARETRDRGRDRDRGPLDILSREAWRTKRWASAQQWDLIRPGMNEEQVEQYLGPPSRSVNSMRPRVDKVLIYEESIGIGDDGLRGKIGLRGNRVIEIERPTF